MKYIDTIDAEWIKWETLTGPPIAEIRDHKYIVTTIFRKRISTNTNKKLVPYRHG